MTPGMHQLGLDWAGSVCVCGPTSQSADRGDHSEALHAYRRCRDLLPRFLAIPPNAKTRALYHSVIQNRRQTLIVK